MSHDQQVEATLGQGEDQFSALLGQLDELIKSATESEDEGAQALALRAINW